MALEGGLRCLKYLMFIFNFLFVIVGLVLIIVGALLLVEIGKFVEDLEFVNTAKPIALFVIIIGAIIFFIAAFGCFGACQENSCCLVIYSGLLTLILVLQIAAVIFAVVNKSAVQDGREELTKQLKKVLDDYTGNDNVVDLIQSQLDCCGVSNYTDWAGTPYANGSSDVLPDSCCKEETPGCGKDAIAKDNFYKKGCEDAVIKVLEKAIIAVLITAIVVIFIQIFGIISSCLLIRGVRKQYETV